jgi:hypothetical protein
VRFPSVVPWRADKARFQLQSSEELCREIRVENKLQDGAGNLVSIKQSAEVEAAIGAGSEATQCDPKRIIFSELVSPSIRPLL